MNSFLAVPMDIRIPKIRVISSNGSLLVGERIVVIIDEFLENTFYPIGHFTRVLGKIGDSKTEIYSLCIEHQVENHLLPFSRNVIKCLPVIQSDKPWKPSDEEIKNRLDLRETHNVVSIDPCGCEDIDDALSIIKKTDEIVQVGIHIADVSYFVSKNTAIDKEAQLRSTSIYLVNKRLDMLPRELSTDLCSLRSGMDRYALSVLVDINIKTGDIDWDNIFYGRTIVRSRYSLSYEQAQNMFDRKPPGEYKPDKKPDNDDLNLDSSVFYKYHKTTGGPVNENDIKWLTEDITLLVNSINIYFINIIL